MARLSYGHFIYFSYERSRNVFLRQGRTCQFPLIYLNLSCRSLVNRHQVRITGQQRVLLWISRTGCIVQALSVRSAKQPPDFKKTYVFELINEDARERMVTVRKHAIYSFIADTGCTSTTVNGTTGTDVLLFLS